MVDAVGNGSGRLALLRPAVLAAVLVASMARADENAAVADWGWLRSVVPKGPYSSWSEKDKKTLLVYMMECAQIVAQRFEGKPRDKVTKDVLSYQNFACLIHSMPDDWPSRAYMAAKARESYARAKQIDPTLPDPEVGP